MTDDEILAAMKEANVLLDRYCALLHPVAEALAARLTEIQGRKYEGGLGGYDCGVEVISIEGECAAWDISNKAENRRTYDFADEWRDRMVAAGIKGIGLSTVF